LKKVDRDVPKGLAVHVVLDNYGTHNHPNVRAWLAKHPRFHFHFTPTSSSWLNLVERWFRDLTDKTFCKRSMPSTRTSSTPRRSGTAKQ
jgi:transposase